MGSRFFTSNSKILFWFYISDGAPNDDQNAYPLPKCKGEGAFEIFRPSYLQRFNFQSYGPSRELSCLKIEYVLRNDRIHKAPICEIFGTCSLSSSSRFPLTSREIMDKPVTFPPGRARLAATPAATGSR